MSEKYTSRGVIGLQRLFGLLALMCTGAAIYGLTKSAKSGLLFAVMALTFAAMGFVVGGGGQGV